MAIYQPLLHRPVHGQVFLVKRLSKQVDGLAQAATGVSVLAVQSAGHTLE